ncbi:MAG: hypothetical protein Q8O64_19950 [Sideroxyarcus sp.]|nr:hypothetical protein [Sideroxyarcus sp.]
MATTKQNKSTVIKSPETLGINFWVTEFFVFLSQVAVIFLVAFFISDMFHSESRLTEFVNGKINTNTMTELLLTLFAITFVMGLLAIAKEIIPSSLFEKIAGEVLNELPRTIYLFGSSITAVTAAVATFIYNHPDSTNKPAVGFFTMSVFFALTFFAYGCGAKALLTLKKAHNS